MNDTNPYDECKIPLYPLLSSNTWRYQEEAWYSFENALPSFSSKTLGLSNSTRFPLFNTATRSKSSRLSKRCAIMMIVWFLNSERMIFCICASVLTSTLFVCRYWSQWYCREGYVPACRLIKYQQRTLPQHRPRKTEQLSLPMREEVFIHNSVQHRIIRFLASFNLCGNHIPESHFLYGRNDLVVAYFT